MQDPPNAKIPQSYNDTNLQRSWTTTTQSGTETCFDSSRDEDAKFTKRIYTQFFTQNQSTLIEGVPQQQPEPVVLAGNLWDHKFAPAQSWTDEGILPDHTQETHHVIPVQLLHMPIPPYPGRNRSTHVIAGKGVKGGGTDPPIALPTTSGEPKCSKVTDIDFMKVRSTIVVEPGNTQDVSLEMIYKRHGT